MFLLYAALIWHTACFAHTSEIASPGAQDAYAAHAAEVNSPLPDRRESPARAHIDAPVRRGNSLYFHGNYAQAVASYEEAIRISSTSLAPWLNGAAVLDEAGSAHKAAYWYQHAAQINSADNDILTALGWAQLRVQNQAGARESLQRVLRRDAGHTYALLGMARLDMLRAQPQEAVALLNRGFDPSPLTSLAYYFLGLAYEQNHDRDKAIDAYRQGVGADSYFTEARQALGRAYLRVRRFNEACKQFRKVLDSDPHNPEMQTLIRYVQPLLSRTDTKASGEGKRPILSIFSPSEPATGRVPLIRAGIGTNAMGKPRARQTIAFSATTDFTLADAKTGKTFASGKADEFWFVRVKPVKKRLALELGPVSGRPKIIRREAFVIRPKSQTAGLVALSNSAYGRDTLGAAEADKLLRGEVELSIYRRTLRVINILDLESYTHGVVSAEMPVHSPLEALKAQAVVARTHALFIKTVTRRHRKEGYDVCDEQHCQVYAGARAESERSRSVVEGTRGLIVSYRGKPAHTIYSSNCGGHTQSGRDLTGWGDVPYWLGICDSAAPGSQPDSPWALRRWLTTIPPAYCKPSIYVHPSHFRWTRIVPFSELARRIARKHPRLGRLKGIQPLRRSPAGNVNALLLKGTKRNIKVDSEMAIRGLLGMGSLRSTLFVFETEYGPDEKPTYLVFHGGGWGHGVGLCQSGAMGRAEAGQNYQDIIQAYFPKTSLQHFNYIPQATASLDAKSISPGTAQYPPEKPKVIWP